MSVQHHLDDHLLGDLGIANAYCRKTQDCVVFRVDSHSSRFVTNGGLVQFRVLLAFFSPMHS